MFAARRYLVENRPVCLSGERCRPNRTAPTRATVLNAQPFGRFGRSLTTMPRSKTPHDYAILLTRAQSRSPCAAARVILVPAEIPRFPTGIERYPPGTPGQNANPRRVWARTATPPVLGSVACGRRSAGLRALGTSGQPKTAPLYKAAPFRFGADIPFSHGLCQCPQIDTPADTSTLRAKYDAPLQPPGALRPHLGRNPPTSSAQASVFSVVGFAKGCRGVNIPVPERGCWARHEAGQTIARATAPSPQLWNVGHDPHRHRGARTGRRSARARPRRAQPPLSTSDEGMAHVEWTLLAKLEE